MTPEIAAAVRETLREVIKRYGAEVARDPSRCQGILRDFSPDPATRAAVAALVVASREGAADLLISADASVPLPIAIARLSRQMRDAHATDERLAFWAVESWAIALGVATPLELQLPVGHDGREGRTTAQPTDNNHVARTHPSHQRTKSTPHPVPADAVVRFICPAPATFGYAAGKAVRGYVKLVTYGLLGGRTFGYDTLELLVDPPLRQGGNTIGSGSLFGGFQCDASFAVRAEPYTITAVHRVGNSESDRKSVGLSFEKPGKYAVMVAFARSALGGIQGTTIQIVQEP